MFQPTAKIIADSVNPCGDRLTTFVLTYHRFIHAEMLTHRVFARNASSSRAIPVEKMIKLVEEQEVYPLHWGKTQKGMSAREEITDIDKAREIWGEVRQDAIKHAKRLVEIGIHKQVVNRLLEPFSTITVICSGTEYQNFFNQRCHPDAQPEIRALADAMKAAYDASEPEKLKADCWHIPFFEDSDKAMVWFNDLIKVAVGRCARVSYLNHDGKRNLDDDIKLHDRLLASQPPHLSPFEHVAMAMPDSGKYANFVGFRSYRNMLEDINYPSGSSISGNG